MDSIRDEKGRFKPGCSGNPTGKPAGTRTYLKEQTGDLKDVLDRLIELSKSDKQNVALRAIETILDRCDGKPRQIVDNNVDGSIIFKWEEEDPSPE